MNITDISAIIADKHSLTKSESDLIVREVFASIAESLAKGEEVKIANFGTFVKKIRSARNGVNPVTHEKISIPETTQVAFKAAKHLKDSI